MRQPPFFYVTIHQEILFFEVPPRAPIQGRLRDEVIHISQQKNATRRISRKPTALVYSALSIQVRDLRG